jgi:hypothetical protein
MGEKDESLLKKEFKEKDVNRIRNIVRKKHNDNTVTQIGYKKNQTFHKEGDIWEEDEKQWIIKDGIKQSYSKIDSVRKSLVMPIMCPNCGKPMKHIYDKKYYSLHSMCFGCVISMETLMRVNGTYKEYANKIVQDNMVGFIKDAKDFVQDFIISTDDVYTEQGDKQEMVGGISRKEIGKKWIEELNEFENNINNDISSKNLQ